MEPLSTCGHKFLMAIVSLLLVCIVTNQDVHELNLVCPHTSQWSLRANAYCSNGTAPSYFCLYDENTKSYTEFCKKNPDFQRPGFKFVIRGELDGEICNKTRFQPFKFWTNKTSQCEMTKSKCTHEGQVIFYDGNETSDRTCRCDYTKGYSYVTQPDNGCYCKPEREDCTCFLSLCETGYVMSPDYQCVKRSDWKGTFNCTYINMSRSNIKEETKLKFSHASTEIDCKADNGANELKRISKIVITITIAVNIIAIIFVIFMKKCGRSIKEACREYIENEVKGKIGDHESQFHVTDGMPTGQSCRNELFKLKIKKNYKELISSMNYEDILRSLIKMEVLTSDDRLEIEDGERKKDCNHKLLEKVWNSNEDVYNAFFTALKQHDVNLARKLENTTTAGIDIQDDLGEDYNENIPQYNRELNRRYIRDWIDDDQCFTATHASEQVKQKLRTTNSVMVVGDSGAGKTSIIRHIAVELWKEGYDVVPIVMVPLIIRQFYNPDRKQVFVVDDFCGRDRINEQSVDLWVLPEYINLFGKIIESSTRIDKKPCEKESIKILFACNMNIFNDRLFRQCLEFYEKYALMLSKYPLQEAERVKIMKKRYLPKEIQGSAKHFQYKGFSFPLLCKLSHGKSAEQLPEFFEKPSDCIQRDLRLLKQQHNLEFCVITLLSLNNNTFKEEWLDPLSSPDNIRTAMTEICTDFSLDMNKENSRSRLQTTLQALEKTYLTKTGGNYHIVHANIYEMSASVCGQYFFDCFINHASSVFIGERYDLGSVKDETENNLITISAENEKRYFDRLVRDLENGDTYSFLHNKQLRYSEYREKFITYCYRRSSKIMELLDKMKGRANNNDFENSNISLVHQEKGVDDNSYYKEVKQKHNSSITNLNMPLIEAVIEGHVDIVRMLIDMKCDINETHTFGRTPFYIAALLGHTDIVRLLLEKNADVSIRDHKGRTVLYVASEEGHQDIVTLLLSSKIKLSECDDEGLSPLHAASAEGHDPVIKILLGGNADIELCDNEGRTPLFIASSNGRKSAVKMLLNRGASVKVKDKRGRTPLFVTCEKEKNQEAQLLLKNGADVSESDNCGQTPLLIASSHGYYDLVALLLENEANINQSDFYRNTPLHVACKGGHENVVQLLLSQKDVDVNIADENKTTALHLGCEKGCVNIVSNLILHGADNTLQDRDLKSAMFISCEKGRLDVVRSLFNEKKSNYIEVIQQCDKYGISPLHVACTRGYLDIATFLIKYGADLDQANKWGKTPLFMACREGHYEIVDLLLKKLAKIEKCDENKTAPLHVASEEGYSGITRLLLSKGATISICDNNGSFPLHSACQHGHEDVVKVLLENGADTTVKDNNNKTPLDIAQNNGYDNIVKLLAG